MRSSCARQNSPINWKLDSKNISCRQHSDLFSKNCKKYCVTPPQSGSDQQLAPFDPIAHLLRVLYLGTPWLNSQSTLGNPDLSWGDPRVHQGCVTLWRWTTWRLQTIQYTLGRIDKLQRIYLLKSRRKSSHGISRFMYNFRC